RPRDRKVVARAEEDARVRLEVADEAGHQGGLADSGLARDEDDAPLPARRLTARLRERAQRVLALEQLHGGTINAVRRESSPSERERDLREPVRRVEVAAAELREAYGRELTRDHRGQGAQPLRHVGDEPQRGDT